MELQPVYNARVFHADELQVGPEFQIGQEAHMPTLRTTPRRLPTAGFVLALAACGGTIVEQPSVPTTIATAAATPVPSPRIEAGLMEGIFQVGDRNLFLSCRGDGSPTIIYFTGMGGLRSNAGSVPDAFTDELRWCSYDRPNGPSSQSDPVDGPQLGSDAAADLHGLLEAADVPGPYLLVGGSFGGLLATTFAGTYPDEVAGIVLLDAILPTHDEIHNAIPEASRGQVMAEAEANPEKFVFQASLEEAKSLMTNLPDVPVAFLGAEPIEAPTAFLAYDKEPVVEVIRQTREDFVAQFTGGRITYVEAPHFMEPVVPGAIIEEVRGVLEDIAA